MNSFNTKFAMDFMKRRELQKEKNILEYNLRCMKTGEEKEINHKWLVIRNANGSWNVKYRLSKNGPEFKNCGIFRVLDLTER